MDILVCWHFPILKKAYIIMHALLAFIFIYIIDVYIYLFYIFYYKVKFRVYFQINQRDDCILISVLNGITSELE